MNTFLEYLNDLIAKCGQGALADQVKSDGSILCRFRSGQGSISLYTLEELLKAGNAVIISRPELRQLQDALSTISDLWHKERLKNLSKGDGTRKNED